MDQTKFKCTAGSSYKTPRDEIVDDAIKKREYDTQRKCCRIQD
jgi:hypothetical protein